jgi:glycosyltransferase involved in cell wall biosynthesis
MTVDLHILTWNESEIIRMVLQHYKEFCRAMYVYDNHSTDNTREIASEEGAIVKLFGTQFFDDKENMDLKNSCWLGSDADYVIVCDADEVLFCTCNPFQFSLHQYLGYFKSEGATIIKTIGWQVMSDEWPDKYLTHETNGFRFDNYSKNIVFNPKEITEIGYGFGAHECNPKGNVVWSELPLYVLHYKHIGGVQRTIDRYKVLSKRLSKNNRKNGHGVHYHQSPSRLKQEWQERMKISRPLI